jgi:AcrR family transcriptional regulator
VPKHRTPIIPDPDSASASASASTSGPTSMAVITLAAESPAAPASTAASSATYHHGDLRRALLDAAVASIADSGPAALSLRALAATAGVSHAAPVHHFGDKAGLFTAVAIEGFDLLGDDLATIWSETGDFLEVGVGYIRFALEHRGHFEVMFRPELTNQADGALTEAKVRNFATLSGPLAATGPARDDREAHLAGLASWSIVHGLATLALSGNLSPADLDDPEDLARHVLMFLRVV